MIVTDFTSKYTVDNDEKILLRKINDLINKSRREYAAVYSHFLDPVQQSLISGISEFYGYISFDGGYVDAERRICRASADEYCQDSGSPVVLMKAVVHNAELSHRDVLGSLMGLGIKREMIGDILPDKNTPRFFCYADAADYIEFNLSKIGRYNAEVSRCTMLELPEQKFELKTINVSSMRLDSVTAESFGISRSKAVEFIKKGAVAVNWIISPDISREIKSGDKISLRGKGKIEIADITGKSRKGRLFVEIKRKV